MTISVPKVVSSLKPLWLMLTGGAFISFAGGALTLFYFWGIGGVPIGQAASAGSMAKVVLPTAALLGIALMAVWLVPTVASLMFDDEQSFAVALRRLFIVEEFSLTPTADTAAIRTNVVPAPGWEVVPQWVGPSLAVHPTALPSLYSRVRWFRIGIFSFLTVGVGSVAVLLYSFSADPTATEGWGHYAGWASVSGWVAALACSLGVMWWRFNKTTVSASQGGTARRKSHLLFWFAFGFFSSAISVAPLLTLLLVFLRSDLLLESETMAMLAFGAVSISLGIVFAYAVSLGALVARSVNKGIKWVFVLGLNAFILGYLVMALGLSSRMLEAVMVLASVRVENAVITLESEGCELLASMDVKEWGYTRGSTKICVLPNVTIQSTLEPAMQVACWRGTIPRKKAEEEAPLSAAEAPGPAAASAPLASNAETARISGQRGAFSIPVKYVRSIWKTGGIATVGGKALCPPHMEYLRPGKPASMAPAQSALDALVH